MQCADVRVPNLSRIIGGILEEIIINWDKFRDWRPLKNLHQDRKFRPNLNTTPLYPA